MSDSDYEPEYEPETVTVLPPPSPLEVTVLTLVPPPLEYMSALHTSKSEVSSRVVWTGSLMLARHVLLTPSVRSSMSGRRVLELGAGTGLVGLSVCMSMEEGDRPVAVCMTDGDQEAIDLLRQNAGINGVNISAGVDAGVAGVPDRYLWGGGGAEELMEWCASHFGDGGEGRGEGFRFDVLLAGDVLYKEGLPGLFFQSVETTMAVGGALYLCHVPRAEVTHEVVLEAANAAGMDVERVDKFGEGEGEMRVPPDAKEEDAVRARIYKITRK